MVPAALPFWLPFTLIPLIGASAVMGGWWLLSVPIYSWIIMSVLDHVSGINENNPDPNSLDTLFWHKMVTWSWPPLQIAVIFGGIWWAANLMNTAEGIALMVCIGVMTGAIGINFAHELIHQKNRLEPAAGELLLTSVLYGHFKTEHIFVHHRYVGTPHDPVTARYNENFWHFFGRVLWQQIVSAWIVEADRLHRKNKPLWHLSNPFWRYWGGGLFFIATGYLIAGSVGAGFFLVQAFVAILHLELVNYIEHYGLVRLRNPETGKFEPVRPRHSWNAGHRVTNWFLINLQRHSDHHYKPDRRFPLLQNYAAEEAPQLPLGYPFMIVAAMNPMLYRRIMNPRVRAWRKHFYPEVTDWSFAKTAPWEYPRASRS